jgi:hypothetical protein
MLALTVQPDRGLQQCAQLHFSLIVRGGELHKFVNYFKGLQCHRVWEPLPVYDSGLWIYLSVLIFCKILLFVKTLVLVGFWPQIAVTFYLSVEIDVPYLPINLLCLWTDICRLKGMCLKMYLCLCSFHFLYISHICNIPFKYILNKVGDSGHS